MDAEELAAALRRLMDGQHPTPPPASPPPPSNRRPQQPYEDVLLVPAPTPDPSPGDEFYALLYKPEDSAPIPAPEPVDDHLLDEIEETGHVAATRDATAGYRAKRTGVQGFLAAVLVAVGGALASIQLDGELDWKYIAVAVGQAVLTAVISYLHPDKSAEAKARS